MVLAGSNCQNAVAEIGRTTLEVRTVLAEFISRGLLAGNVCPPYRSSLPPLRLTR